MKNLGAILVILLISPNLFAAIYGADQRRDISKSPKRWQTAAESVALALPGFYLEDVDDDFYFHSEYKERVYSEEVGVCQKERFSKQTSFGHCTAFLVAPNVLVSAGHCFLPTGTVENEAHSYCENFVFWLGYNDKDHALASIGSMIPKKDIAVCKRVIYATNNQQIDPADNPVDFAIYELETPITHRPSLKMAAKALRPNEPIATIGHPHGLPAKFSGLSPVLDVFDTSYTSNMDTLGGNSGGPAFNHKAEVVGILIAGHQHDTYTDKKNRCERINKCSNSGRNCKMGSDLEESNVLLRSETWYPKVEAFLNQ